ncbi:branched-chain amino acid ABC transporter permease [Mycolicibacterium sp. 624]|uniref:branched-chain amino acid ABC transporter permease n=1 Tax=Mycolicibacterium sp. 624 TaxID=3156314 RepID=UPI0033930D30
MTTVAQVLVLGGLLGLIYTLAGLGMTLSMGVLKVLNLTHGMAVLGGSVLAYQFQQTWGVSPISAGLVALPLFSLLGWILYVTLVRRAQAVSPESALLVLFGAMIFLQAVTAEFWSGDIKSVTAAYSNKGLELGSVVVPLDYLVAASVSLVLLGIIYTYLRFSLTGRAIRALAQRPDAAATLGIDVDLYSSLVFAASVGIAGTSGALLSTIIPFSVATQMIWLTYAFIVVLVGGTSGVLGALVGGLALGLGQALFNELLSLKWVSVVVYALLLVAMVARGGGLAAARERAI